MFFFSLSFSLKKKVKSVISFYLTASHVRDCLCLFYRYIRWVLVYKCDHLLRALTTRIQTCFYYWLWRLSIRISSSFFLPFSTFIDFIFIHSLSFIHSLILYFKLKRLLLNMKSSVQCQHDRLYVLNQDNSRAMIV